MEKYIPPYHLNFKVGFVISSVKKYVPPNARILDFGCGYGKYSYFLASLGYHVLGVDVSEEAISVAKIRRTSSNCKFEVVKDIVDMTGREYDAVILTEVLEHIAEPNKLLGRLNSLMKANSLLILTIPNGYSICQFVDRITERCRRAIVLGKAVKAYGCWLQKRFPLRNVVVDDHHRQYFMFKKLAALLAQNGFEIAEAKNGSFLMILQWQLLPFKTPKGIALLDYKLAGILPRCIAESWWIVAKKVR